MIPINITQDGPDWHEWREKGISASTLSIVMNENPWCTPYLHWQRLVGLAPKQGDNPAMRKGRLFEPQARVAFERDLNLMCEPCCGEWEENPIFRASFDGITLDGIPVELKVPGFRTIAKAREGIVEPWYNIQVQALMNVAGSEYAWFYVYDVDNLKGYPIRVERDQKLIDEMVEAGETFWWHVENKVAPEIGAKDHIVVDDADTLRIAGRLAAKKQKTAEAKAVYKSCKDAEKEDEQLLLDMLDDGNALVGPLRVTRVEKARYDYAKMIADYSIEIEKYAKESIGYPLIKLVKEKASD